MEAFSVAPKPRAVNSPHFKLSPTGKSSRRRPETARKPIGEASAFEHANDFLATIARRLTLVVGSDTMRTRSQILSAD